MINQNFPAQSSGINKIDLTIVGGGMITHDLILPSVYHLQRMNVIGNIDICALNSAPLKFLKNDPEFALSFPSQGFTPHPSFEEADTVIFPDIYKDVLAKKAPYQAVIVAVPDQMHYEVVMEALRVNQHVLCVKPLVLKYNQSREIEKIAFEKGLFVGVEYHKRFDRRALIAKRQYELGRLGEFILGEARLIEPYYYRHSNFQNWFTCENTDPFVYVGCHYTDLLYFITNLKPIEVSVRGIKGTFPNGKKGYLWSNARIIYENSAIFSVTNGLGYPNEAGGPNEQGLTMYFEGKDRSGYLYHDDQFRGVEHSYLEDTKSNEKPFNYINPDFYRLVPWEGVGYKPVGYGYDSISASIMTMNRIQKETENIEGVSALKVRQKIIREVDKKGIIATPANSFVNELVTEAARLSILNEGKPVEIIYGDHPNVRFKH